MDRLGKRLLWLSNFLRSSACRDAPHRQGHSTTAERSAIASRFSLPPLTFGVHSPGLRREIELQHRGDGVDPQPVDMELVKPVKRACRQKIRHLTPAEIIDCGSPLRVKATPRIGIFVKSRTIEMRKTVCVSREMRRHPIQYDPQSGSVSPIDKTGRIPTDVHDALSEQTGRPADSPSYRPAGVR